jgi:hypothetical protein
MFSFYCNLVAPYLQLSQSLNLLFLMGIHQISKYNYEFIIADDVSGSSEVDSS